MYFLIYNSYLSQKIVIILVFLNFQIKFHKFSSYKCLNSNTLVISEQKYSNKYEKNINNGSKISLIKKMNDHMELRTVGINKYFKIFLEKDFKNRNVLRNITSIKILEKFPGGSDENDYENFFVNRTENKNGSDCLNVSAGKNCQNYDEDEDNEVDYADVIFKKKSEDSTGNSRLYTPRKNTTFSELPSSEKDKKNLESNLEKSLEKTPIDSDENDYENFSMNRTKKDHKNNNINVCVSENYQNDDGVFYVDDTLKKNNKDSTQNSRLSTPRKNTTFSELPLSEKGKKKLESNLEKSFEKSPIDSNENDYENFSMNRTKKDHKNNNINDCVSEICQNGDEDEVVYSDVIFRKKNQDDSNEKSVLNTSRKNTTFSELALSEKDKEKLQSDLRTFLEKNGNFLEENSKKDKKSKDKTNDEKNRRKNTSFWKCFLPRCFKKQEEQEED